MNNDITRYRGRFLSLVEREGWEFTTRPNAHAVAVLVATTDDDCILLVEQFRKPVDARVLELPAGLVGDQDDPNEPILEAAGRELIEETGYRAARLETIIQCPSSAGMTDEVVTFVRASGLEKIGPGGGDETEDIEVHVVPLAEVDGWLSQRIADGMPLDPKIYAALHWLNTGAPGEAG
jgi:ADP-ribose pyrophosphatase